MLKAYKCEQYEKRQKAVALRSVSHLGMGFCQALTTKLVTLGIAHPKIRHRLLTLMTLQTCMIFFLATREVKF